jgi:hypothetical protein
VEVVVQISKWRAAIVAAVLSTSLLTAGCTPAPLGMVGVYLDGGYPTALLRPCPGITVTQVWVYQRGADLRWGVARGGNQPANTVRLLAAPAGWTEQGVPAGHELTEFMPETTYQVQVATDRPDKGQIHLVEFGLGDLKAESVWATQPHGTPQVLTREQFDKAAADNC